MGLQYLHSYLTLFYLGSLTRLRHSIAVLFVLPVRGTLSMLANRFYVTTPIIRVTPNDVQLRTPQLNSIYWTPLYHL